MGLLWAEEKESSVNPLHTKISLSILNGDMPIILDSISTKYNIHFSYNSDIVNRNKKITITFKSETLEEVLKTLFIDEDVSFEFFGDQIIIYRNTHHGENLQANYKNNYQKKEGIVIDKKSKKPIPYAHVYTRKDGSGTITNNEGEFEINVPVKEKGDELVVSFIGYKDYTEKLSNLRDEIIVELDESMLKIEEVTIIPFNPQEIIRKAVGLIPHNYSLKPQICKAFFREYNKMNDDYISLSEAVLNVYKAPYRITSVPDVATISIGRKSSVNPENSEINFKVQGGIYYCLKLDVVKSIASFLSEDFFDVYEYKLTDVLNHNGSYIYEISFDQKDEVDKPYYKGKIYIDVNSLAITGVDFYLSDKQIEMAGQLYVRKKPLKFKVQPVTAHYRINYLEKKGRWYLNNIKSELVVNVSKRNGEFDAIYSTTTEMLITSRESKELTSFKRNNVQKSTDIFVEQIVNYDQAFWGDENIIKPDLSIQQAYKKITSDSQYVVSLKSME